MAIHYVTLPRPKGRGRTFDNLAIERAGGMLLTHYAVRLFVLNTHSYARGGAEGAPGPVIGWGVSIEDSEGFVTYVHESKDQAAIAALFARALAKAQATTKAGAR